jgi:hypothetical protein
VILTLELLRVPETVEVNYDGVLASGRSWLALAHAYPMIPASTERLERRAAALFGDLTLLICLLPCQSHGTQDLTLVGVGRELSHTEIAGSGGLLCC